MSNPPLKPRAQRRREQGARFTPIPYYAGNGQCVEVRYRQRADGATERIVLHHEIDRKAHAGWFISDPA